MTPSLRMNTPSKVKKRWTITAAYSGCSSRDFLFGAGEFSRQLIKKVRISGSVFVNGERVEMWQPLRSGDLLEVEFPKEERGSIEPMEGSLSIVYEDEDVLVINKPAGLFSVPAFDKNEPSVAAYLLYRYIQENYPCTVHIVTRLDKDTSGLMLAAKHAYSHRLLTQSMKKIDRRYKAVAEGSVQADQGIVNQPIARAEGSIIRRTTSPEGRPAETRYEVEKRSGAYTWLRLQLMTGRTHQIRVHLEHLGYPLAGDTLYGGNACPWIPGQALHCYQLNFRHPWSKKRMTFVSETPGEWDLFA
ncbi:RluA family pseudouridine synthase [Halobacillus sp. Cin3]|uniref:RluA family pseudouridine synthase n=1 Tax=Halobacillus sp. Cin3 TaxID=2928441 RepID=UPI00248DF389|nr:RluA family pseudouridine synthase [Halobacillus sp. Cin3]